MRAALYQGKKSIEMTSLPDPVCGNHDIIIENLYASICGTDVAVYEHGTEMGHRITIGGEFGHEMVSRVKEVGKNVTNISVGDRVYPYPRLAKGDPRRAGTVGGFSEYILVPNAELNRQVYLVDEKISDRVASLIEPFTVGCRAARRSSPRNGEHAVVFGAGTIGIAAAIALQYFGCDKVMICDHSDYRLDIVKKLGFEVCNNSREDVKQRAMEVFGEAQSYKGITANVDIYVDAAGADAILDLYEEIGKLNSRLVMVAVGSNIRPVNVLGLTFGQLSIIGSGGYLEEDVRDVMKIMESHRWDIESIITNEFPWEKLPEAIETAADVDHALNVIIKY